MTNPVVFEIGGTDYGALGPNVVTHVPTLRPTGPGVIGRMDLEIAAVGGGGYSFVRGMEVRSWEKHSFSITWNGVLRRLFGGFVQNVTTTTHMGTNLKIVRLECTDYNLLFDVLVIDADTGAAITVPSNQSFAGQVSFLVDAVQKRGTGLVAQTIDATSFVVDLWNNPVSPLPAVTFKGVTLGAALDVLIANVQAKNSALQPARHMGQDESFGAAATCGYATLHIYDRAAPGAPRYTFTDGSAGGTRFIGPYGRKLEGSGVIERQQTILKNGKVYTGVAPSPVSTPNPYINHGRTGNKGYWMAAPVSYTNSDIANAPTWITRKVTSVQNPRETLELTTDVTDIEPGQTVAVTIANEGLSSTAYKVADTPAAFPTNGPASQQTRLQLAQRRLQWWENGSGQDAVPVVRDIVPPGVATLVAASTVYDPFSGQAKLTITWVAPPDSDLAGYDIHLNRGSGEEVITVALLTSYSCLMPLSTAYSAFLIAFDYAGNHGDASAIASGSSGGGPNPQTVRNPSFEIEDPATAGQPWAWTGQLGTGATQARDTAHSHSGAACLALASPSRSQTASSLSYRVLVNDQRSYTLEAFIAAVGTGVYCSTFITWYDRTNTIIGTEVAVTANQEASLLPAWGTTATQITPPSGAAAAMVRIQNAGAVGATTLYVDDVTLQSDLGTLDLKDATVTGAKLETFGGGAATILLPASVQVDTHGRVQALGATVRGTAFPGSPASGDPFFRTDLGLWCYYDGTRWLTEHEYTLPFTYYPGAGSTFEWSGAGTTELLYAALRGDRATFADRFTVLGYVNGTNNSTNYWQIVLRTFPGTVNLQIAPLDTKAWTGTTFTRGEATSFSTQPATTDLALEIAITKVGTPGPLRFAPTLYVREVVT